MVHKRPFEEYQTMAMLMGMKYWQPHLFASDDMSVRGLYYDPDTLETMHLPSEEITKRYGQFEGWTYPKLLSEVTDDDP